MTFAQGENYKFFTISVVSATLCGKLKSLTMLPHLQAHIGSDLFFSTHPFLFNFVESTIPRKNLMVFFSINPF